MLFRSGHLLRIIIMIIKRCPIIRTLLAKIIADCWVKCAVPDCWKRGSTILIYKKGDQNNPSNFRPITIQPCWYKIFASLYRNRIFDHVCKNNYIDKSIQKGFWPGSDGVSEHTELLAHMIKDAKRHQRSLIIILLDLRNAFGEVHHELIRSALAYHHLPDQLVRLFNSIYCNSFVAVSTGCEWTSAIRVEKGVLQGDPCSPLLFNLCFNLLMMTLHKPEYQKLGGS